MTPSKFRGGGGGGEVKGKDYSQFPFFLFAIGGEGRREGWGGGRGGSSRGLVKGGWGGVGVHLNTILYKIISITTIHYMFSMVSIH